MKHYSRLRRVKDTLKFINHMAKQGPRLFEATKSAEIAKTYGVEVNLVRRMKARKRTELSFAGDGK